MDKQRAFTDPYIRALKPKAAPYKRAEHAPRGEGRLIVRVLPSGTREFFYRYRTQGQDKTLALGRYDQTGNNGKTLAGIRKALRASRELQRDTGDVKEHRAAEARKQDVESRRGSFEQLLGAYVAYLRAEGRPSADQVETIFKRHVLTPFPLLKSAKATEIEPGDIQRILGRMVKAGITRQVNKTRAYLRAAFAHGGRADHDPRTVAQDGVLFALKSNPVTLVPVIRQYERTRERTLTDDELREYIKGLEALPMIQRATLRFNLALACQRPTQLVRADWTDFDFTEKTLLLRDSKGRGGSRDHLLPLTPYALEQLKPLRELNARPHKYGESPPPPFSSDGKRRLSTETLSAAVAGISATLTEKKVEPFQLRDLRRTAETMLQRLGVDREVRAHLLSHGRTQGVQGKHYERYDFLKEKRAALEKWEDHLRRVIDPNWKAAVVAIGRHKSR